MIEASLGFIVGFAACLVLWLRREVERSRAFKAACDRIETLEAREKRLMAAFGRIRARAKQILNTGGTVELPSPAAEPRALTAPEANGQPSLSLFIPRVIAGPLRVRRSRFFQKR